MATTKWTTTASRLAARLGEADDARVVLRALYDSFTEGFETKDLQDAKALL